MNKLVGFLKDLSLETLCLLHNPDTSALSVSPFSFLTHSRLLAPLFTERFPEWPLVMSQAAALSVWAKHADKKCDLHKGKILRNSNLFPSSISTLPLVGISCAQEVPLRRQRLLQLDLLCRVTLKGISARIMKAIPRPPFVSNNNCSRVTRTAALLGLDRRTRLCVPLLSISRHGCQSEQLLRV